MLVEECTNLIADFALDVATIAIAFSDPIGDLTIIT